MLGGDVVFRLLGVMFGFKFSMKDDINQLVKRCRPKMKAILRRRYVYPTQELIKQYKTHIWSVIEYHSASIYHATVISLQPLDNLHYSYIRDLGISAEEAFLLYNFPPAKLRRDIGMLGCLHKRVLGRSHPSFAKLFPFKASHDHGRHSRQLETYSDTTFFQEMLWKRSLFALAGVYNTLPQHVVDLPSISDFQTWLTHQAKHKCSTSVQNWY